MFTNFTAMKNIDLSQLSLDELRELNHQVMEVYSLKVKMNSLFNKNALNVGMTVRYVGGKNKIQNETFVIEKIMNVNARCKSNVTGVKWNIKLANLEPC